MESNGLTMINLASKKYSNLITDAGEKVGLTKVEMDVLLFLANNPEQKDANSIVTKRGIAKSFVSKAVSSLIKKGLLTSVTRSGDKRYIDLYLTSKAEEAVDLGRRAQNCFFQIMNRNLSLEDKKHMALVIEKIIASLNEE